jgi:ATP-dependent RNA helicase DDX47/RRP3
MLSLDFEKEIQEILRVIPEDRNSYLFSATMTKKVNKLQKLSLKDPTMVEVSNKMQTPKVSELGLSQ